MHVLPSLPPVQAETSNHVAYLHDQDHLLCASMSSIPLSRQDFAVVSFACFGVGGDKRHKFVGSAGHDFVGVGGEQNFVGSAGHDFVAVRGEGDRRQKFVGSGVSKKRRQCKRQP